MEVETKEEYGVEVETKEEYGVEVETKGGVWGGSRD